MIITILGTGSWEGTPAIGCQCKICSKARSNPGSARTRPSLLVRSSKDSLPVLIDCSPDIRLQLDPKNKVDTVLVSHFHHDHVAGLQELHAYSDLILKTPIHVMSSQKSIEQIDTHLSYLPLHKEIVTPFNSLDINGLKITPFPVYHIYNIDSKIEDVKKLSSLGFKIEHNSSSVVYTGDFYTMPEKSKELIFNSDILITDGTYLFEDRYSTDYALAIKSENDSDHLHGDNIIDFAGRMSPKKIIYHSVSHLSGLFQQEMQSLLPENHLVVSDGYTLTI